MLSGRYPSDEFAELRPRITWDRVAGTRHGARGRQARGDRQRRHDSRSRAVRRVPRSAPGPGAARVGELDEEMVFESRVGETFLLGASSWRIEEITHDRVLVSPAPGEPGKMPFWHGDRAGRPLELGLAIGGSCASCCACRPPRRIDRLTREHDLDARAAENLLQYLDDQAAATGAVPDDRTDRHRALRDELGDWRVCVLSPLGGRIHAPWAMAVAAQDPRGDRHRRRDALGRRRVRGPVSGRRRSRPTRAAAARPGGGGGARGAPARRRPRSSPAKFRENAGAVAAPAAAPARAARAAVAAAQARRRPAGRGVALRLVPGPARDLPRVPARRLRHAGAHRDAARRPQPQDARRHRRLARRRRRSPPRCSSATSRASSTTATRRSPSGGRRRWPSIRRSCASCSATRSCASCSTPTSMDAIERQLQRLDPHVPRQERRRGCTTCCCRSAI